MLSSIGQLHGPLLPPSPVYQVQVGLVSHADCCCYEMAARHSRFLELSTPTHPVPREMLHSIFGPQNTAIQAFVEVLFKNLTLFEGCDIVLNEPLHNVALVVVHYLLQPIVTELESHVATRFIEAVE